MNSICLSVASNLRCEGLTRTENIILLVPAAVELVFTITLALTIAENRGRRHWLLVLDGLSFFLLALLDFLSHIIPEASANAQVFKIIDLVLGGLTAVPLLAYTLFLFLFARSNLVSLLPVRFRRVTAFALFATIPPVLVFNALGSLLGISHRILAGPAQTPVLAVGFVSPGAQRLALFFSSTTLALLAVFQAALFVLSFMRVVRAFLDERRVEGDPDAEDQVHLFRGVGWLAVGLKLGAAETIVGFANVSFGVALTRRVLRLFARGAVIISIIKGMNIIEDFVRFDSDVRARGGHSKRLSRFAISNPRLSTFREMSPKASAFHSAQREKRERIGPSPLALGADSTLRAFDGVNVTSAPVNFDGVAKKERVTVYYDGKTPPVLQMRFSRLDMPLPIPPLPGRDRNDKDGAGAGTGAGTGAGAAGGGATFSAAGTSSGGNTSFFGNSSFGNTLSGGVMSTPSFGNIHTDPSSFGVASYSGATSSGDTSRPRVHSESSASSSTAHPHSSGTLPHSSASTNPASSTSARMHRHPHASVASVASDSLEAVREIAARFPGLPPRVVRGNVYNNGWTPRGDPAANYDPDAEWRSVARARSLQRRNEGGDGTPTVSPDNSIKRKRPPVLEEEAGGGAREPEYAAAAALDTADSDDAYSPTSYTQTPDLTRVSTLESPTVAMPDRPLGRLANRVMAIETKMAQTRQDAADAENQRRRLTRLRRELRAPNPDDMPDIDADEDGQSERARVSAIQWLHDDPLSSLPQAVEDAFPLAPTDIDMDVEGDGDDEAVLDEAWRRAGLMRIKSVGRVRVHTVEHAGAPVRGSLFVVEEESLGMPESFDGPRAFSPEEFDDLDADSDALGKPARLDSGVLGEDDRRMVRQGAYF